MSDIVDLLLTQARDLEKQASAPVEQWAMIKQAAVDTLVNKGTSAADADNLLDNLADRAYPNREADLQKAAEYKRISTILEKTAAYVAELESKIESNKAAIGEMEKEAEQSVKAPSVGALDESGMFTAEDLAALRTLEAGTLDKVASLTSTTPMNMGGPSTRVSADVDPLTAFLMN